MTSPLNTPVRQAKLGLASTKSAPLANEYKKLLNEQHQRLWTKHQQDLDLIDDIRSYVKSRLSIERDYTSALSKLAKQHSGYITKKFTLLSRGDATVSAHESKGNEEGIHHENEVSDSRLQKHLANNGLDEPDKPCSLYKVWSEHINRLQSTSKNRADQFEQLIMIVDKLKDIRSHKANIGKKCLDTHLKRIHEDILASMVDVDRAKKLYYEDESQAKKARENEEKIKRKRSGLLTKLTDLQAKKEKTSAQREANDIQSTQARNDYIMALAAGNAHLEHYYQRDLTDFIQLIDDGVLDHCKIFMATLSECDINSLKDALTHAQYWSKMINLTGSQKTNYIFLDCEQSACLRGRTQYLSFEPCNNDPIRIISLEHNADYALQHEIDKWFTWFKKECRNLTQLMHHLEMCQRALADGKKTIELNGQAFEDLEPKIIELKQQIRKSEAAKLKAQARLKVIREGGMQIEEWSAVESEIRADMARAQEELEAKRAKEMMHDDSSEGDRREGRSQEQQDKQASSGYMFDTQVEKIQLQVSKDSDDSDAGESTHNLASVSRSTSNLMQKQQNAASGYSALTDPSLVWQDDYSNAWGSTQGNYNVVVTEAYNDDTNKNTSETIPIDLKSDDHDSNHFDLSSGKKPHNSAQPMQPASMTVQSSSPLSAIVDGNQSSPGAYQTMTTEAYKSDYECDYNRTGHLMRSTASSAEPYNQHLQQNPSHAADPFDKPLDESAESKNFDQDQNEFRTSDGFNDDTDRMEKEETLQLLNRRVIALYAFDKTNADDLPFDEDDILRVIEVNDADWVKARNESTGEEGYIPASYVRLLNVGGDDLDTTQNEPQDKNITSTDSESAWNTQDLQSKDEDAVPYGRKIFCRALYDYKPEADTYEDDGLPHISLIQGEIMRIIDQGEDDGWWLVEKEDTGARGHVPSMLVEEIDPETDDPENENDDGGSEYSETDDLEGSIKAMPCFEPPVLQESLDESVEDDKQTSVVDLNSNTIEREETKPSASLVPTSFIIIEPTPEVESRRVGDPADTSRATEIKNTDDRQVVRGTSSNPPSDVSYSVINEDFVLEGPTRKPHHVSDQVQHHETPTILEENLADEVSETQNVDLLSKTPDGNYEPLSEVDSLDMPAPPSVVIDSFEEEKPAKSPSSNGSDNGDERSSLNDYDIDQPAYVQREIKHTGNVDVNPMLRHRADEFSKQIIAEAIMLTPGANVGPSTSSANIP